MLRVAINQGKLSKGKPEPTTSPEISLLPKDAGAMKTTIFLGHPRNAQRREKVASARNSALRTWSALVRRCSSMIKTQGQEVVS